MHQQRYAVQTGGQGLYLAAWRDGAPVGNVLLHFMHPPHHASHARYPEAAYVEALDVPQQHRRGGIALALMTALEQEARARGATLLGLSVGAENGPARALYRKLGYQPSELPDYWVSWAYIDPKTGQPMKEGETCSLWIKPLANPPAGAAGPGKPS
jgi:ribosomal protein S18 acetylase RimI-like enzyme